MNRQQQQQQIGRRRVHHHNHHGGGGGDHDDDDEHVRPMDAGDRDNHNYSDGGDNDNQNNQSNEDDDDGIQFVRGRGERGNDDNNNDEGPNGDRTLNHTNANAFRVLSLLASPFTDEHGSFRSVVAGLCLLFVVGTAIGLAMPKNEDLPSPWYRSVSAILGWIYFLAWSVSFYPQVLYNFRNRQTDGLSPDFCVLNVLGFACYAVYNVSFFYSKTIQELYRKRHGKDAEILVQSNDVAFALHAFTLSLITVLQIVYYGHNHGQGGLFQSLKLSRPIRFTVICILVVCIVYPILVIDLATTEHKYDRTHNNSYNHWKKNDNGNNSLGRFNWLDYLYMLSFVKIFISLIKYIPQVILNCRRRSTEGWSIWNIILDFTGGVLSVMQLVFDCADLKDFTGITGNPAKFGLGFVSIFFDLIFMLQHYCLYHRRPALDDISEEMAAPTEDAVIRRSEQEEPLLQDNSVGDASTGPRLFTV